MKPIALWTRFLWGNFSSSDSCRWPRVPGWWTWLLVEWKPCLSSKSCRNKSPPSAKSEYFPAFGTGKSIWGEWPNCCRGRPSPPNSASQCTSDLKRIKKLKTKIGTDLRFVTLGVDVSFPAVARVDHRGVVQWNGRFGDAVDQVGALTGRHFGRQVGRCFFGLQSFHRQFCDAHRVALVLGRCNN